MEEVKKVRRPPDPNSAKYKLGQIAAKAYSDVAEAKARGEKIGWISSNFPVEIPETLGIPVCYPENQAAGPVCARRRRTRAIPTISAPTPGSVWPTPNPAAPRSRICPCPTSCCAATT